MARLLLHAVGRNPSDNFGWPIGGIVDIKPDTHIWGSMETLPTFWKVNLPGVDPDAIRDLLAPQMVKDDGTPNEHPNVPGKIIPFRRKEWKADTARIPGAILDTLNTVGEITFEGVGLNQIRNALRRIRDDTAYSGF